MRTMANLNKQDSSSAKYLVLLVRFSPTPYQFLKAFCCLGMIGTGKANVHTVVSIAQSQMMDGPVPPAIEAWASLGSHGAHPNNEERDMQTWLKGLHDIQLEVYYTTVRVEVQINKRNRLTLFQYEHVYL